MAPPPIQLFLTTIASQITLRQRQEYILRILQVKKIPFTSYDLASDEDAKRLWRRKAPRDKQQLPGILVGGEFPGTFEQFEEAVEFNELSTFLRLNEDYTPFSDDAPLLHASPIGVPGAYSPLQMHPQHAVHSRSPSPSPLAVREREKKETVKADGVLEEFGLGDVSVSVDELAALVSELGLGGEEARELVSGLSGVESKGKESGKKPEVGGEKGESKSETKPLGKGKKVEEKSEEKSESRSETKPLGKAKKVEEKPEEKPAEDKEDSKPKDEAPPPKEDDKSADASPSKDDPAKPSEETTDTTGTTDKPEPEENSKSAPEPRIKITPPHHTLPVEPKATS
ncbi:hypothetical protein BC629DRAFT_1469109 [Irpex lacteus]|nr:hypothetical protein BC629DRAFT_1469109 [Irpex lacteus]